MNHQNSMKQQWLMAAILVAVLVTSRWIPHPANFTALVGVALFAGAFWRGLGMRFAVPLLATLIADIYFGFYPGMEWTYLGIAASVLMAPMLEASLFQVGARAVLASIVFFVFSNLGVWWSSGLYTVDMMGLGQCFTAAIPFFPNTVVSGVLYSVGIFSIYRLAFSENGFRGFVAVGGK